MTVKELVAELFAKTSAPFSGWTIQDGDGDIWGISRHDGFTTVFYMAEVLVTFSDEMRPEMKAALTEYMERL